MILSPIEFLNGKTYQPLPLFERHLHGELSQFKVLRNDGDLITVESNRASDHPIYWAKNIWEKPFIAHFSSISQAAHILKSQGRHWAPCSWQYQRRTALIAESLPYINNKPKSFPSDIPKSPMGAFALLSENSLIASAQCSSPWPNGEFVFQENKEEPPSRAYLKLWEALLHCPVKPKPKDRCLDAGACPGGWTWVLAKLGAQVLAVDKAPLAPLVQKMPGVQYLKHNAFTLKPQDVGPLDWFCSDVICYPKALYEWILPWVESGMVKNFICTIKMQGEYWDHEVTQKFAEIPHSKVLHLHHNKHELTWIRSII